MEREQWLQGVQVEISFWTRWVETKGLDWPGDYSFRIDPNAELQDWIGKYITAGVPPRILDVGAGPMTTLGKKFKGMPVDLTAVDALADLYSQLNFAPGLPLVRTQKCDSELLSQKFPFDSFDVVFARNTLDHSYDPVLAIKEMIKVAKPAGVIITDHLANEGIREEWQGFHQWNFHVTDSDFKISNREKTVSVSEAICGLASIIEMSADHAPAVKCVMRKN